MFILFCGSKFTTLKFYDPKFTTLKFTTLNVFCGVISDDIAILHMNNNSVFN